jgi:hypothetical protein
VRQLGRPQNHVARLPFDLDRLPVIQPWIEEIEVVLERVLRQPRVEVLIHLGQALESSAIAANVGQQHDSLQGI